MVVELPRLLSKVVEKVVDCAVALGLEVMVV